MSTPLDLKEIITMPASAEELGIPINIISDLVYRMLFNEGDVSVSRFTEIIRVHPQVIDDLLARMQQEHLVEVSRTGSLGRLSYTYRLTDEGTKRARDSMERSLYIGPAPVDVEVYKRAIIAQTSTTLRITPTQVRKALSHLILPEKFDRRIGPAVNTASSLFLYGPPGNGKTTIAEAIAKLISGATPIWLPYAITTGGQIIQVIDPLIHIPAGEMAVKEETANLGKIKADRRWGLFERPAVMVGGELKMDALDLRFEPFAKFYEAPLQLKANGGMFLIDDFGRQQISPQQLLNRWIVPLESRIDFLRLQSGQTIEAPFRQLLVFSTNLDPEQLVDDAFLRRIQMKVGVFGPDEKMFFQIFKVMCESLRVPLDKNGFMYLIQKWYREPGRTMQAVHPRDLLKIIVSICTYENIPVQLTPELIDEACSSYFVDKKGKGMGDYKAVVNM
ncbi:MAG: AAA family ATPase [Anaerolineae bacterium]|nr:AAA family ATPase [Anaerolineae bacterium]